MSGRRLRWILAAAVAATPGLASAGPDPVRGLAVAQTHCAGCHAIGPAGASPFAPAPPFRDLHSRFPVADLVGAVGEGAATGHPAMPRFRLETDDRLDLVAYVLSVQKPGAPDAGTARVLAGKRVAEQNCGACHARTGSASPAEGAPPFPVLYLRYGPGGARRALEGGMIANYPKTLEEGEMPMHPDMPRVVLGPDEIASLTAYLDSLDQRRPRP